MLKRVVRTPLAALSPQPSAPPPFDPLTTFDHWWNAADTGTLTGTPTVTAMADQVSTWHILSNGANGPTTGSTTLNSKNVLTFDGSERLWYPDTTTGFALADDFDWFALMYFDGTDWSGGSNLLTISDPADNSPSVTIDNATTSVRLNCAAVGATAVNAAAPPSTGWHLFRIQGVDNTSLKWWFDGVEQAATGGTYTGFGGANVSLGIAGTPSGLGECVTRFACSGLFVGGAATSQQVTDFHAFLNSEYGLSLP